MVTGIVTIVKEVPQKIWNSIVGAVTKVATWGTNMLTKSQRGNEHNGNRHCYYRKGNTREDI